MGILPSKESHEYPGAFHFAQSGCHAMAILPLTEHFFPSVDSLAFKQLYACRDMQSAKYNFSLVSPQIIAKYRERAMEQLREKALHGEAEVSPPKDRCKPRPCLSHADGSAETEQHPRNDSNVADTVIDEAEAKQWVAVDTINAENFHKFFRSDTQCISPDESEWPFPHGDEELCGELQHPNPSAHWRTHDAAKQYLQLENQEMGLRNTAYATATSDGPTINNTGLCSCRCGGGTAQDTPSWQSSPSSRHPRSVSLELGMSPEAAAEYADQEREYVDRFFSRSPEALYNALVVEPNRGFLVDTNKEMCEIYAAETRWKEARKIVRAYRRQCKEDEAAAKAGAATVTDEKPVSDDIDARGGAAPQAQAPPRRITKEEADEAAKVPPPSLFLRPAPQVIVVRIHREEEEAARAKYFAEQQRKQRRQQQHQQRRSSGCDAEDNASASSRSARSPTPESNMPLPAPATPCSPTPSSVSHLHTPTTRYHRFEDDDRYKDGRIHLVEEDGVLYMFAYNTAYVDPRKKLKEWKQQQQQQQRKPTDPLDPHNMQSSSAAGGDDNNNNVKEDGDATASVLAHESRQTSSFYHTVGAFGFKESETAPLEGAKKAPNAAKTSHAAAAAAKSSEEDDDDDDDTALSAKRGGRSCQQDTVVFVDEVGPHTDAQNPPELTTEGDDATDDDEEDEEEEKDDDGGHRRRARQTSTSGGSESVSGVSPTERPREVQQLQLLTAAPFILPICPVRVVGCNGYTESTCRGTPWLRGYDDDPEEDAYVESLPVRPPVMSGGGFIDANIGDKILSRAFLLGLQVFRNVCLDAGLPETLTRPFWTLGLLSNIPLLQISREMRFRMRAAAAEVQFGFQGLRDMIKGTENDLQSYIYGFSDILPYLERASQARLMQAAAEEAAIAAGSDEGDGSEKGTTSGRRSLQSLHPLLLPESNEPYTLPTRASQPIVQRSLRLPRGPIEFYTQLTIRGNQCLSRVRTESQLSFFHLIAEATAPVSTSLFMKPLELSMYDYGGAVRLHLLMKKGTEEAEMQVLPPPKNRDQLIRDHQRRVQLRRLAKQAADDAAAAAAAATADGAAESNKSAHDKGSPSAKPGVRKSAKEREDSTPPPYLIYTIVQPSAFAKGPSLEHYKRIMQGPDGASGKEAEQPTIADLTDTELLSMYDPAAAASAGDADDAAAPVTRCSCYSTHGEAAQPVFAPHQYLYDHGAFVDGDMVVYNIHAGRWEHFEYFHRQQLARRRAQREQQQQQQQAKESGGEDSQCKPSASAAVSAHGVDAAGSGTSALMGDLSDEDEEDIHQEDILLCWIKRRLQSATMRNRQDPGWLRDNEDHIVQEGRYYIWGFEHDDQRYFYGLIPKFAKEKKGKRHSNGEKMMNAHMSMTALNSHRRLRHSGGGGGGGGGGSNMGTPSALSISPNMSTVSASELRRLSIGGRYNNSHNSMNSGSYGGGGSGSYRPHNSPGTRSARSSPSQSTRTPRGQAAHLHNSGRSGWDGGQGHLNSSGNFPGEVNGGDCGESGGSGCHVQADAQLDVSFPESQARWAMRSPVSGGSGGGAASSPSAKRRPPHFTAEDGAGAAKDGVNSPTSTSTPAGGQKPPAKVSAFLATAAAQTAAAAAKDSEWPSQSSSSSPNSSSGQQQHSLYPPRIVSAPLQSTISKSAPTTTAASTGKVTGADASNAQPHSLSSSSNEGYSRVRGGQQRISDVSPLPPPPPPPPPPQQQQQQQQQQQLIQQVAMSEQGSYPPPRQQQQHQHYFMQRGGPPMTNNSGNNNTNNNEWYAARETFSNHGSPPPPPSSIGPAGSTYDNSTRGYMNLLPPQQQQQQMPHLHPPTVYMNTSTVNIHGNAQQQQQQQQQQLPQPRRSQQQQQFQQGPPPQITPQGCPLNNSQAASRQSQQQQQQMSMMPGSGPYGSNRSPLPQSHAMSVTVDASPSSLSPPSIPQNVRRYPSNTNNVTGGGPGMYVDPSNQPALSPSFYPEAPMQQQQQQQLPLPPSSSVPPHMQRGGGDSFHAVPPPPPSSQQQQQQQRGGGGVIPGAEGIVSPPTVRYPAQPPPSQQPYNAGPYMTSMSAGIYGDASMAPPMSLPPPPPQQQQQHQFARIPLSTPQQQQQQQQPPTMGSGNVTSPCLPRQMMGNPNVMPAGNNNNNNSNSNSNSTNNNSRSGGEMGMYGGSSSTSAGLARASTSSSHVNNNNAGQAGWGSQSLSMPYNNSSNSDAPTPSPANAGRGGGSAGGKGPYLMPNANASAPLAATATGRSNVYQPWSSVSNTANNRASPLQQQQQQQVPYQGSARDAGYAHDAYSHSAGGASNHMTSSPYPQQFALQQQQQPQNTAALSHTSSYAPTPLPPSQQAQHSGSVGNAPGMNNAYAYPQQQQPAYQGQGSSMAQYAPIHNNPYSNSVTASSAQSYAPHPSVAHEPFAPPTQQQQQHYPFHGNNSYSSNNPYGYGGSTSPPPQQEAPPQPPQQHLSPAAIMRSNGNNSNMSVQQQQQHLVTPTSSSASFARHASGGGGGGSSSGTYAPSPAGPANTTSWQSNQNQQQHSMPPSPSPSSSHFPSGPLQQPPSQQQQLSPPSNASGILLRSTPNPPQRQHQPYQQQRHPQQQQQQQSGGVVLPPQSYNLVQSPASQPLQCSADSCGESGNYDRSNSPGQQQRFAHNPYAMQ